MSWFAPQTNELFAERTATINPQRVTVRCVMTQGATESQVGQWAARQLADYDRHDPGTLFAEGVVLNLADAYRLQSAVDELRTQRGERMLRLLEVWRRRLFESGHDV